MMIKMRTLALRSEIIALTAKSKVARERARGRGDAVAWWYIRNVELLCFRPAMIEQLQTQAEAVAQAEEDRGCRDRAEARRGVDRWVVAGFARCRSG